MCQHICLTAFGLFLLNTDGEVAESVLMYPDVEKSVDVLTQINSGDFSDSVKEFLHNTLSGWPESLMTDNAYFAKSVTRVAETDIELIKDSKSIKMFRSTHDRYLVIEGIVPQSEAVYTFKREVTLQIARNTIIMARQERDILLKNAVDAIDEIDKSINLIAMRLREWYSIYHPTVSDSIEDHVLFSSIVDAIDDKASIERTTLVALGLEDESINQIMRSEQDLGVELFQDDLETMKLLARDVSHLFESRLKLEDYVERLMNAIAPNITHLIGPLVGARLMSLAGSLKILARKPSSTVQVLGAEKALFRSLKTGSAPPKHGIIFQVPEVNTAPYWQRGKIARAIAGKLSIAAKIDAYTKRNIGPDLKKDLNARIDEIRKQNPEPPPTKKDTPTPKRKKGRKGRNRPRRKKGGKSR